MIECVLFDSDGTLVESEYLCNLGIALMFKELGIDLNVDALVKEYRGWKLGNAFQRLSELHDVSLPPDFEQRYRKKVDELFREQLKPVSGIPELLTSLSLRSGVVTNGPRKKVDLALSLCGMTDYFGASVFSAYDLKAWKPDPEIYIEAARRMGFKPEQCVVLEDSLTGVEAGYRAGMLTYFLNHFDDACPFEGVKVIHSVGEFHAAFADKFKA